MHTVSFKQWRHYGRGRMTGVFRWPSLLRNSWRHLSSSPSVLNYDGEDDRCLHVALLVTYSWNANQTWHSESNHCYPCRICSVRTGYDFFKARQHPNCRGWPKSQQSAVEHPGLHRKQDQRYQTASSGLKNWRKRRRRRMKPHISEYFVKMNCNSIILLAVSNMNVTIHAGNHIDHKHKPHKSTFPKTNVQHKCSLWVVFGCVTYY